MPSELEANPFHTFTINMFPRSSFYANALKDVVNNYGWNKFTLIYEDRDSLSRLHQVLQNHDSKSGPVAIRRIPSDPSEYKPFLKTILKTSEARFIVDLKPETVYSLIKEGESIDFIKAYSVN